MLGELTGSINKERALVYLTARGRGYAREIARFFNTSLDPMQKALDGLERAGVLVSRVIGSTREYEFNPRYALRDELRTLLEKALTLYPAKMRDELRVTRTRPRRRRKPL